MTDPLDDRIRDGLTRLAAAVPVREADVNVAPVVATPVRTRALGRLLPAGASLLAAGVAVVVVASTFHIGPFTPGASPGAAPVVATVTDGPFELSLGAAKAVYAANEPIDIDASLTFHGANPISIGHALGAPFQPADPRKSGPLNFGIEEPVLGTLVLAPGWRDACASTTLQPDVPLTSPFAKSAGFSGRDPRADEYRAFVTDPVLRLAPGTWHVYAVAEFSVGGCSADDTSMRVDLEITVVEAQFTINVGSWPPR